MAIKDLKKPHLIRINLKKLLECKINHKRSWLNILLHYLRGVYLKFINKDESEI